MELVLSLFPGIDLFGRAFEAEGYCVVRGPDLLFGQDVREFRPAPGRFDGIIAGSPCQDYSRARRSAPTGAGDSSIEEFRRVVTQARPPWFLLENVPGAPRVCVDGFEMQYLLLAAHEFGSAQHRLRLFQFGRRDGPGLVLPRTVTRRGILAKCCVASEGTLVSRRTFSEFCALQGLPGSFDLPGWSLAAKYRAVGNGVPLELGRALARAVRDRFKHIGRRVCVCGCGQVIGDNATQAGPTCRKRMQRQRDRVGVTGPGGVTRAGSRPTRSA